ncbi:hypothetical protein [Mesorhizobium sp. SP-1A]|uniref:hypothetical protein n=1 Tax=Mesorhizobium sp. SP-1A TaxID=3077840 RepID=UPI0028F72F2E|nr:hypothetical protein [Mesorhizobium sp. SP-1A]
MSTDLPTFHCPLWPRCECPDGSMRVDCPGLSAMAAPADTAKKIGCPNAPNASATTIAHGAWPVPVRSANTSHTRPFW